MASLDDILSVQKNAVVAVSSNTAILRRSAGTNSSAATTSDLLVVAGPGRLVSISVIVGGSAFGGAYNAATIGTAASSNQLCATLKTEGVYQVGMEFINGLVIKPGSGQTIAVTYTPGA